MAGKKTPLAPGMDDVDAAIAMKTDLLEKIETLGDRLPPNTIDELIDSLGGPESVAEVQSLAVYSVNRLVGALNLMNTMGENNPDI